MDKKRRGPLSAPSTKSAPSLQQPRAFTVGITHGVNKSLVAHDGAPFDAEVEATRLEKKYFQCGSCAGVHDGVCRTCYPKAPQMTATEAVQREHDRALDGALVLLKQARERCVLIHTDPKNINETQQAYITRLKLEIDMLEKLRATAIGLLPGFEFDFLP